VRRIAPTVFGRPVLVPPRGEYVADGAARQAAWMLSGGQRPPSWTVGQVEMHEADAVPAVRERYAEARANVLDRAP
jgi:xylulokinase